ncbi:unnamed protein product [Penicillium salamii]|nr:unnamed protein product [Penicillium salamii]
MGVEGLRALRSFKVEDQAWNGDHDQVICNKQRPLVTNMLTIICSKALFAILKHILQDGGGVLSIEHNVEEGTLFVRVDRSKIISHGKPSIGRMLCKIHIWHSTADIEACRPFYNSLSVVDGEFETWRKIVASNPEPKWKFVQPNTFLKGDGTVELREYDASNEGIIHSFFDRMV